MASKPSYRPRRTRIYGANYDIGESYYKKQLEDLDNKRFGSSRLTDQHFQTDFPRRDEKLTPKVSFLHGDDDDDHFRYKPTLRNKPLFDDEDDDILNSSFKPYASKFNAGEESSYSENARQDLFKRVLGTPTRDISFQNDVDDQVTGGFSSRRFKLKSESYTADDRSEETSSRMKATKARLADLESEMVSINEKQSEREKRKHNLRKLLHESGSDTFNALDEM